MTTKTDETISTALDHLLDILTDELHDWDDEIFEGEDEAKQAWNQEVDYIHEVIEALKTVKEKTAAGWVRIMDSYPRR